MLEQDHYRLDDPHEVERVVREHPWATLVSDGPVVSHLPVLLDGADRAVVGHVARGDAREHRLGTRDVVLVFQGPHGYISPSWYEAAPYVPTWNYVVVHLHGRPELLDDDATFDVLRRTVDRFEPAAAGTWSLAGVDDYARRIAAGVTAFRLVPSRVVAKAKLSQDKSQDIIGRVVQRLDEPGAYANPALAGEMRRLVPYGLRHTSV